MPSKNRAKPKPAPAEASAPPAAPKSAPLPPLLRFAGGGWCEALRESYAPGYFQPRDRREYEALRPFAAEEFRHD